MRRAAALLVRLSAAIVPSDLRHDWRREWLAELESVRALSASPRLGGWRFALGAPRHAWALRQASAGSWSREVKFGVRWLWRRPLFCAAAVLTLSLGTGAAIGLFSVAYAVLWKPLPYREPHRLVQLYETNPLRGWTEATIAPGNLISWRERTSSFDGIAFYIGSDTRRAGLVGLTLTTDEPRRVSALAVSDNFFDVLGVAPKHGRLFAPRDAQPGSRPVAVVTHAFWARQLGADPAIVGRTIPINGAPREVVGVLEPSFEFDGQDFDLCVLIDLDLASQRDVRVPHWMRAIARLTPGVSADAARHDLETVAAALEREHPESNRQMGAGFMPATDWFVGPSRRPILLFLLGVGLLLLLACANVAGLLLARAVDRRREFAVRASLGATTRRLVRQLLTETLLLATAGTALGVLLATMFVQLFLRNAPSDLPRLGGVGLESSVAWSAVILAFLTTAIAGIAPALQASRFDLRGAVGDGARGTPGGARRLRRLLVATQVAVATALLIATFLTGRSVRALTAVDPGFPVDGLFTARVDLPGRFAENGRAAAFFESLGETLRGTPGIAAAGSTAELPLGGLSWTGDLYIDGQPDVHGRELRHKSVTIDYLEALGVRLLAGRTFTSADGPGTPRVVVANEALVRQYFAGQDPIGKRIAYDPPNDRVRWRTIVGVVSNESQDGLAHTAVPEVYEAARQASTRQMALLVRSDRGTSDLTAVLRNAIRTLDPGVAFYDQGPFSALVDRALAPHRIAASLVSIFGGVALVLSAVGIYGVAAQAVSARTREIGLRMAFGANRRAVAALVLRQEFATLGSGAIVGGCLALIVGGLAQSFLYGVPATDPWSLVLGIAVLAGGALLALWLPARRAFRVDPVVALREG